MAGPATGTRPSCGADIRNILAGMADDESWADIVLQGGTVMDLTDWTPGQSISREWRDTRPRAIAVSDGLIVALGAEAQAMIGPETEVIETRSATVIPGIIDAHMHFTAFCVADELYVDLNTGIFTDISQLVHFLTPDSIDGSGWIRGRGWDELVLGRNLTSADIDEALARNGMPQVPVVLFDWSGHALTANTAALEYCRITAQTPDVDGGVIARDEDGKPNGFMSDAALALVIDGMPPIPTSQLLEAYRGGQRTLHALGITSLTEPGLGPGNAALMDGSCSVEALHALGDLAASGELTLRITVLLLPVGTGGGNSAAIEHALEGELVHSYGDRGLDARRLRIAGVKVFADGSPQNGTTWHFDPVHEFNPPGHRCGHMVLVGETDEEKVHELKRIIRAVDAAGLQVAIHCVGDRTVATVIEAIAEVAPHSPHRHYLIHATELYPEGMRRLADSGIGATFNPVLISTFGQTVPLNRAQRTEPIAGALAAGARVAITSDAPVVYPDWRPAVEFVVTRSHLTQSPTEPDRECITSLDALALFTREAAYRDGSETWRGTLSVGQRADLAVLDGDWPEDEEVASLRDRRILLTMVDGAVVHRV